MKRILVLLTFFPAMLPLAAWTQPGGGPPPASVVVSEVFEKEVARTSRHLGGIDFETKSGLSPEVSGLVASQGLSTGLMVKKGETLLRIQTDFVRKDLEILDQQILQIGVRIDNTRKNLKRYEALYKEDAASQQMVDDLSDGLRELLVEREVRIKEREKKALELEKSTLRAPFDGLVLERHVSEGEWVSPGKALCLLADITTAHALVALPEGLVQFMKPGVPLSIEIPAMGRSLTGAFAGLVPVADPKSKTLEVKFDIPFTPGMVQNMTAAVDVPVSEKVRLKMIPRDALVRNEGRTFVYTIEDQKAKILPVEVAAMEERFFGVETPTVTAGMQVVVDGNDRLRPGQPVTVIGKK